MTSSTESADNAPAPLSINENVILKQIVHELENSSIRVVSVEQICQVHGIKRRGLHDLMSVCSVFGICRRVSGDQIEWLGLSQAFSTVALVRRRAVCDNGTHTLSSMFDYSTESPIPRISLGIVRLFFALGVKFLDIRKVAQLFGQGKIKHKTMLRKLYTVVNGLEIAGIVSRTTVGSEIRLNHNLRDGGDELFCLASMLNSREELEREAIAERRRKEFEGMSLEFLPQVPRGQVFREQISHLSGMLRV
jgi:hypothetical protein